MPLLVTMLPTRVPLVGRMSDRSSVTFAPRTSTPPAFLVAVTVYVITSPSLTVVPEPGVLVLVTVQVLGTARFVTSQATAWPSAIATVSSVTGTVLPLASVQAQPTVVHGAGPPDSLSA